MSIETCSRCCRDVDTDHDIEGEYINGKYVCEDCTIDKDRICFYCGQDSCDCDML